MGYGEARCPPVWARRISLLEGVGTGRGDSTTKNCYVPSMPSSGPASSARPPVTNVRVPHLLARGPSAVRMGNCTRVYRKLGMSLYIVFCLRGRFLG